MILSYISANALLDAFNAGAAYTLVSLDLGQTKTEVRMNRSGVTLPGGNCLDWLAIQQVSRNENACFTVTVHNDVEKIQAFSEEYNRLYSLMPVAKPSAPKRKSAQKGKRRIVQESAPTMLISGIPMHRIKETTPQLDTQEKIRAAGPIKGAVLDTATGLGYTAIAAARTATSVTTIELDPVALEICRLNPWSQSLFSDPKINQEIGDSFDVVESLADNSFDVIVHDPPMFAMAGHLYSADFYIELLRVLRPKGKLFHYIGNPESKSGRNVTKGVLKRINDVGFAQARPQPRAFGITAQKA